MALTEDGPLSGPYRITRRTSGAGRRGPGPGACRSLARNCPSPPCKAGRSPKVVTRSGRLVAGAQSRVGTGWKLCDFIRLGVEWSPVTIRTSGFKARELRHLGVERLDHLDLLGEVAVLARAVGVLVVDEEEVKLFPLLLDDLHLVGERLAGLDDGHPNELRQPAIHRVDGDRDGLQAVGLFHGRDLGELGEPAHHQEVRRPLVLEHVLRLAEELGGDLRRLLRRGVAGLRFERVQAGRERVGVGDVVAQPLAAEPDDEAVLADGLNQGLDALDLHPSPQFLDELLAGLGRDPAGPAVGDAALGRRPCRSCRGSRRPSGRPRRRCRGPRARPGRCRARAGRSRRGRDAPAPSPARCPGATGVLRPTVPSEARASRFGVRAVSSSVLPPGSIGRPPRPSATSITILVLFGSSRPRITSCIDIGGLFLPGGRWNSSSWLSRPGRPTARLSSPGLPVDNRSPSFAVHCSDDAPFKTSLVLRENGQSQPVTAPIPVITGPSLWATSHVASVQEAR